MFKTAPAPPSEPKFIRKKYPCLRHIFADGSNAGLQIVKRPYNAEGFELLPRRWLVARTFAWLGRCRRLAKDFEPTIASAKAWVLLAHIRMLTKKVTRQTRKRERERLPFRVRL